MTDSKCVKNCATCGLKYEEKCVTAGDSSKVCVRWEPFEESYDTYENLNFHKYQESLTVYDPVFDGCC